MAREPVLGCQQHQIDIPGQPAVLEAVVQDHNVRTLSRRLQCTGNPIGIGNHWSAWVPRGMESDLIATVPTRNYGRPMPLPQKLLDHPTGHRRLSGPSHCQIAYRDYRDTFWPYGTAPVQKLVSNPHRPPIDPRDWPK